MNNIVKIIIIVCVSIFLFLWGVLIGRIYERNQEKPKNTHAVDLTDFYEKASNRQQTITVVINCNYANSVQDPLSKISDEGYFPEKVIPCKDGNYVFVLTKRYPNLKEREEHKKQMELLKKRMTKDENEVFN
jgi:hypothetical protein